MDKSEMANKYTNAHCAVVILSAGTATRFGDDKVMQDLCGKPVICRTAETFLSLSIFEECIIVVPESKIESYRTMFKNFFPGNNIFFVPGGENRAASSRLGLRAVSSAAKFIAIHDGDRPLVSMRLILSVLNASMQYGAAAPALESADTIKEVDARDFVIKTIRRDTLRAVQTPQIFRADWIRAASEQSMVNGYAVTDDCSMVEQLGKRICLVPGDRDNIKITVPRDLDLARIIFSEREASK